MSKILTKSLLIIMLLMLTLPSLAFSYGYGDSAADDPVYVAFKKSISAVKTKNWKKIKKVIRSESVKTPIASMDNHFKGFNLMPEIEKAVADKDYKQTVKLLANLIYLSTIEKFEIMVEKKLEDPVYSKSKLAICKIYYSKVLRGYVAKHDKKNGTSLDKEIIKAFKNLGSLYKDTANVEEFKKNTDVIKNNLNTAFGYFVFKVE